MDCVNDVVNVRFEKVALGIADQTDLATSVVLYHWYEIVAPMFVEYASLSEVNSEGWVP